jgi:hypothetical protein
MENHYPLEIFSQDEIIFTDDGSAVAHRRQCEPERRLLAAVLKDALSTYKKYFSTRDPRFEETERWIFGEDTDRLFAFKTLCAMLGLCAERIRKDLRDSAGPVCLPRSFGRERRAWPARIVKRRNRLAPSS